MARMNGGNAIQHHRHFTLLIELKYTGHISGTCWCAYNNETKNEIKILQELHYFLDKILYLDKGPKYVIKARESCFNSIYIYVPSYR